ncbi:MAG: ABC transporter permease [Oscillospiraceae bacterium]|nr:ABC transporter permease [Oscillospiraceae bacterium]
MLFFKECKKVIFSLTFIIYFAVTLAMYFTQFHNDCGEPLRKPGPSDEYYGTVAREIPEILMPNAAEGLVGEYLSGSFSAYPYGFYKNVRLSENKKFRLAEVITELSGLTAYELDNFEDYQEAGYVMGDNNGFVYVEANIPEINIPDSLTYDRFRELMREADKIIGGGSRYSDEFIVGNFSLVPRTYEDALAEYERFLYDDKITGAYARLYCDYIGIDIAILPVFVAAALAGFDKKSGMEQLVYSRKVSSGKLVFTRFLALVTVMAIPIIITAAIAYFKVKSIYPGEALDNFAFFRCAAYWLVPNILISTAVGMLVTEIMSGMIAIFVQGAWWFMSIFAAEGGLTGEIKPFTLVMRHNNLLKSDVFAMEMKSIIFNRLFFTVLSVVLVTLTVIIYEMKRRGVFNGLSDLRKNSGRKSKA